MIGGGAISVAACVVLVMVLESLPGLDGDGLKLLVIGLLFALPGIVIGCTIWLYEALKGGDGPES